MLGFVVCELVAFC